MKNTVGKKNIVFGFAYFIATLILGIYLAAELKEGGGEEESPLHELLKAAHAHGNLESFLNIVIGYLICQMEESPILQVVSILLLIGAIFHSGMLYIGGLGLEGAVDIAVIGAISLVATMALMVYVAATRLK